MDVQGEQNEAVYLGGTCCVISHKQFYFKDGKYCSEGGFNKYIEVLAEIFDRIILAVPVDHEPTSDCGAPIKEGIVEFVEMPTYRHRYPALWLLHPVGIARPMARAIGQADLVHVMFPGYIQLIGLLIATILRRPVFCSLVGDWESILAVSDFAKSHRFLIRPILLFHRLLLRWILRSGPAFVYGRRLLASYQKYTQNAVAGGTSTFSEGDLRSPDGSGTLHDPPRLLYVGRQDYKKGVGVLIEAMSILHKRGCQATLSIVGTGPNGTAFEKLVRDLGLDEAVDFRGYVRQRAELWQVYREHDVFVLPSFSEGMPQVIIEAFASGLPVVATNVGGIPDLVNPGGGLLVPPRDKDALADAIERVLSDEAYRRACALRNLDVARVKTMEAQVKYMSKYIREALPEVFRRKVLPYRE